MKRLILDDQANSALVGLLVSALFFGIALTATLGITDATVKSASSHEGSDLRTAAHHVLDLLIRSPGIAGGGGSAWQLAPDNVKQIGLAVEGRPNLLHADKVAGLRSGGIDALANGFLDYAEAKDALALEGLNFHLRTFPAIAGIEDPSFEAYRGYRAAYVGHFEVDSGVVPTVGVNVATDSSPSGYTEVFVTVTYFDGPASNLFQITLDLDTGQSRLVENHYTPLIIPGGDHTVRVRYYDADWASGSGDQDLRVSVTDAATATNVYDNEEHVILLNTGESDYNLLMEPGRNYYHGGSQAKLTLDKAGGDGRRYKEEVQALLTVADPTGVLVLDDFLVTIPKASHKNVNIDLAGHPYGTYIATLTAGSQTLENRFTWTDEKLDSSAYVPSDDNKKERGYIEFLFEEFTNETHYSGANPADVYRDHMDDTSVLGDTLVSPGNPYDILVVGSRITQSQLQGHFPNNVLTFVQNGGTLIALGADKSDVQWMKSIFGAGVATATGGISTPDPTAAILHSPEELAYQSYDDQDQAYKIDGIDRHKFTHVLVKDSQGGTNYDTLAMSNPGAYGEGTVMVTSYIPNEIFGEPSEAGDQEARKLMHNLVAQAFKLLYLDYGPLIPADAQVGSATRLALVGMKEVPDSAVEVRFVLYVFR